MWNGPYDDFVGRHMFAFFQLITQGATAVGPSRAAGVETAAGSGDAAVPQDLHVRVIRLAVPSPRPSDAKGETKRAHIHRWPVRMHAEGLFRGSVVSAKFWKPEQRNCGPGNREIDTVGGTNGGMAIVPKDRRPWDRPKPKEVSDLPQTEDVIGMFRYKGADVLGMTDTQIRAFCLERAKFFLYEAQVKAADTIGGHELNVAAQYAAIADAFRPSPGPALSEEDEDVV